MESVALFLGFGSGSSLLGFALGFFGEFDTLWTGSCLQSLGFLGKLLKSIDSTG